MLHIIMYVSLVGWISGKIFAMIGSPATLALNISSFADVFGLIAIILFLAKTARKYGPRITEYWRAANANRSLMSSKHLRLEKALLIGSTASLFLSALIVAGYFYSKYMIFYSDPEVIGRVCFYEAPSAHAHLWEFAAANDKATSAARKAIEDLEINETKLINCASNSYLKDYIPFYKNWSHYLFLTILSSLFLLGAYWTIEKWYKKTERLARSTTDARYLRFTAIAAIFLLSLWFIDVPQTVRLKAGLIHAFSLSEQSADDSIKTLCGSTFSDVISSSNCYRTHRDKRFAACQAMKDEVANDRGWVSSDGGTTYLYFGNDAGQQGNMFNAKECWTYNPLKQH